MDAQTLSGMTSLVCASSKKSISAVRALLHAGEHSKEAQPFLNGPNFHCTFLLLLLPV